MNSFMAKPAQQLQVAQVVVARISILVVYGGAEARFSTELDATTFAFGSSLSHQRLQQLAPHRERKPSIVLHGFPFRIMAPSSAPCSTFDTPLRAFYDSTPYDTRWDKPMGLGPSSLSHATVTRECAPRSSHIQSWLLPLQLEPLSRGVAFFVATAILVAIQAVLVEVLF